MLRWLSYVRRFDGPASVFLAFYGLSFSWLEPANEGPGDPMLVLEILWEGRWVLGGLLVIVVFLGFVYDVLGSKYREVKTYLDRLHLRHWEKNGGRDPDYRISFYVPANRLQVRWGWLPIQRRKELKCVHRTDQKTPSKRWSRVPPDDGRKGDGIVGFIWVYGMQPSAKSLPEDPSEVEKFDYCEETHMPTAEFEDRSWQGAAMTGIFVQDSALEKSGVLLVECQRPGGVEIDVPSSLVGEAETCGLIWEDKL